MSMTAKFSTRNRRSGTLRTRKLEYAFVVQLVLVVEFQVHKRAELTSSFEIHLTTLLKLLLAHSPWQESTIRLSPAFSDGSRLPQPLGSSLTFCISNELVKFAFCLLAVRECTSRLGTATIPNSSPLEKLQSDLNLKQPLRDCGVVRLVWDWMSQISVQKDRSRLSFKKAHTTDYTLLSFCDALAKARAVSAIKFYWTVM